MIINVDDDIEEAVEVVDLTVGDDDDDDDDDTSQQLPRERDFRQENKMKSPHQMKNHHNHQDQQLQTIGGGHGSDYQLYGSSTTLHSGTTGASRRTLQLQPSGCGATARGRGRDTGAMTTANTGFPQTYFSMPRSSSTLTTTSDQQILEQYSTIAEETKMKMMESVLSSSRASRSGFLQAAMLATAGRAVIDFSTWPGSATAGSSNSWQEEYSQEEYSRLLSRATDSFLDQAATTNIEGRELVLLMGVNNISLAERIRKEIRKFAGDDFPGWSFNKRRAGNGGFGFRIVATYNLPPTGR